MPFYDHQCEKCNHQFEEMYMMSRDPKEIKCEKCGAETKRLISAAHLGWGSMLKVFTGAEDERGAAQADSHMGTDPYSAMPGEPRPGEE